MISRVKNNANAYFRRHFFIFRPYAETETTAISHSGNPGPEIAEIFSNLSDRI